MKNYRMPDPEEGGDGYQPKPPTPPPPPTP